MHSAAAVRWRSGRWTLLRLVSRDVMVARWRAALLLVFYALYLAISVRSPRSYLLTTVVFSLFLAVAGIGLDAQRGSEALWAAMPLSRATIVRGRYLASAVIAAVSLVMSWLVGGAVTFVLGYGAPPLPAPVYAVVLALVMVLMAAYLPFRFKMGPGPGLAAFGSWAAGVVAVGAVTAHLVAWWVGSPDALLAAARWQAMGSFAVGGSASPAAISAPMAMAGTLAVACVIYLLSMRVSEQLHRERDL